MLLNFSIILLAILSSVSAIWNLDVNPMHACRFFTLFSVNLAFFTLLSSVFLKRKKLLSATLLTLVFIVTFSLTLQIRRGYVITPEVLYAALHPENNEFLTIMSIYDYIIVIFVPVIATFILYCNRRKLAANFNKIYLSFLGICIISTCVICFAVPISYISKNDIDAKNIDNSRYFLQQIIFTPPVNIIRSFYTILSASNSDKNNQPLEVYMPKNSGDDTLKIYYIIGESVRFDRLGINGYKKNTTPNLAKELKNGNLINFRKVNKSCDITTSRSVPCMLSGSQDGTPYNLPSIFKTLGFNVVFRTPNNQNVFNSIKKSIILNTDATFVNYSNDADILKFAGQDLDKYHGKKVLNIIQMRGSHDIYNIQDRVRNKKNLLKPHCQHSYSAIECRDTESFEQMNNSYDNTIVSTDEIFGRLFDLIRHENAILFFASDHAELMGEEGYVGHGFTKPGGEKVPQQYDIPVFIWASNSYISKHGEVIRQISRHAHNPTNHLQLYKSIIACNKISVKNLDLTGGYCNQTNPALATRLI